MLQSHRREIVVLFADIRNFTPFAEASEPEEVMSVLAQYHKAIGALVHEYQGTLERFTGDGIMIRSAARGSEVKRASSSSIRGRSGRIRPPSNCQAGNQVWLPTALPISLPRLRSR